MKTIALAGLFACAASYAMAEGDLHKIAVHVNDADPRVMNMALNNVQNLTAYYVAKGDTVEVEVVAYGPGLMMYMPDSPVSGRISSMALQMDGLTFSACANTMAKMSKKAGHPITLMDEAEVVPSGVVRLVELQEQGYAYVRP